MPQRPEISQHDPTWANKAKNGNVGPFGVILGHFGSFDEFWVIQDHFKLFGAILAFFHDCSGAHINDKKIKT